VTGARTTEGGSTTAKKLVEIVESIKDITNAGRSISEIVDSSPSLASAINNALTALTLTTLHDYLSSMLEEKTLERRARINELKSKLEKQMNNDAPSPVGVEVAKMLSDLPEDKKNEALRIYSLIRAIEKDPAAAMLTMALGGFLGNTVTSGKKKVSLKKLRKIITEAVKKEIEAMRKKEEESNSLFRLFKMFLEREDRLREHIEKVLSSVGQKSDWDSFIDKLSKLKELGLIRIGGTEGVPPELQMKIELEKEKLKTYKELKEKELETKKYIAELEKEQRYREARAFEDALTTLAQSAIKALSEATTEESGEKQPPVNVQVVKCPYCEAENIVAPGTKAARCINCGREFEIKSS